MLSGYLDLAGGSAGLAQKFTIWQLERLGNGSGEELCLVVSSGAVTLESMGGDCGNDDLSGMELDLINEVGGVDQCGQLGS
jgi:hypothetical protein